MELANINTIVYDSIGTTENILTQHYIITISFQELEVYSNLFCAKLEAKRNHVEKS